MKESRIVGVNPSTIKMYNGIRFRSTLEVNTAKTLDKLGIPYEYESRKIVLLEGFRCPYQKEKVRDITYTPDFIIGPIMIECKGFETPEWVNKKKYLFKYLMENEPETIFYQTKDCRRSLLKALDKHWSYLGYAIKVTPVKPVKKKKGEFEKLKPMLFDSIENAMHELKISDKSWGLIMKSLTSKFYAYGYDWELKKIKI